MVTGCKNGDRRLFNSFHKDCIRDMLVPLDVIQKSKRPAVKAACQGLHKQAGGCALLFVQKRTCMFVFFNFACSSLKIYYSFTITVANKNIIVGILCFVQILSFEFANLTKIVCIMI